VSSNLDRRGFDLDTLALIVRASAWDERLFRVEYGFEGYRDFVDSFRVRINPQTQERRVSIQGPVADDAIYDLAGFYFKGFWQAKPSLMCTLGTRFTHARAAADRFEDPFTGQVSRFSGNWSNLSTSLRTIWRPLPRLRLSGGISQGFRAPNLSDLTRLDLARSGELEIPSPHIGPESFWTAEFGTSLESGPLLLHLAVYHTKIRDLIVRTPTGRLIREGPSTLFEVAKTNAGHGWVRGLEVSASMRLRDAWLLTGNVSWLDSELERFSDTSSQPLRIREPLSRMMPPTANLSLRYSPPGKAWSVEGLFRGALKQNNLSESDQRDSQRIPPAGTPGYALVDLLFSGSFNSHYHLALKIENIFDKAYRVHGSGINGAGRNVIVSLVISY
ncbi:MAG TPA: TonB-dependent receptor, partial [Oceanipulchritudo sp.]|nr:TonB-dependent receptor [Oceanipulchritudo sp.]